jgi:hypothetical protein
VYTGSVYEDGQFQYEILDVHYYIHNGKKKKKVKKKKRRLSSVASSTHRQDNPSINEYVQEQIRDQN